MSHSVVIILFFKQKTAYEMRISDWSSDVCSSDLSIRSEADRTIGESEFCRSGGDYDVAHKRETEPRACGRSVDDGHQRLFHAHQLGNGGMHRGGQLLEQCPGIFPGDRKAIHVAARARSEERRVGKECVSTCRSRWSPPHTKNK